MKKIIKKILYYIPFALGGILVILILTGKMDYVIQGLKNSKYINKTTRTDGKKKPVYKDGKLQLMDSFEWFEKPEVNEYDKDNKIPKYSVYGMTQDEYDFRNELGFELLNSKVSIDDNTKGNLVFNKSCLRKINEPFYVESEHLNICINSVSVTKRLEKEEEDNLYGRFKDIVNYLNEDRVIQPMGISEKNADENGNLVENKQVSDICFVKMNITYESDCPWVQESNLSPSILFLNEYDDRLEYIFKEDASGLYSDSHMVSLHGEQCTYYSGKLYDMEKQPEEVGTMYPMMDGESVNVDIGFFVPECFLDKAYICFDYMGYTENTYKNTYMRIIKITD